MTDIQPSSSQISQSAPSGEELNHRRIEPSVAPLGLMINVISVVAGVISLTIIGSVIVFALLDRPIPDQLSNWGGVILGFYFGQFVSLAKDYVSIVQHPDYKPPRPRP